ncbi:MAG: dehydrogenase [Cenarchaeum symbiont of Oopsacas minuta]|nr:dehydrogenase [Cenarchaeum symbiont of Oopsacas minuta]
MERDYDVIVAGGGLAGTIAAQSVFSHSNGNQSILIIDRSPEHMPGSKSVAGWVCGDAVSKEAVDYMSNHIGVKWDQSEIEHKVKGVMAFSPNRETSIPFDGEGYMLNRKLLPECQNNRCKKMGIEFAFRINLGGLLYENGMVVGVRGTDRDGSAYKKTARIVIDATGITSMLRNQIENTTMIEKKIDRHDIESTGRHIMNFETGLEDTTEFDPDYCIIHLDQDIAPGGYGWVFPKGKNKVNIGLGVEKSLLEKRNKRLRKNNNVSQLIDEYVKRNKAIKNPIISTDEVDIHNATGNFQVSVRRQNDCLVAGGYMLVGDSAWMPKPLDAGGIGPALIAGTIVGKCAALAIESGNYGESELWQYNKEFINEYGYKTAGLELFRRLIQTLSNDQISYGMKHFLGNLDVESISKGEHPNFDSLGKIGIIIRGVLNKNLAKGLQFTTSENKWLTEHYGRYPESPEGFKKWNMELHTRFTEAKTKLLKFQN